MTNGHRQFVRNELSKAFVWYLLCDLCWYAVSISSYKFVPAPNIFSDSPPRQVFMSLITGAMNYCTQNLQFSLVSGLTVAIDMYTPQDWPPLMGRLRDVSTVRNFWGKFWHQQLRRVRSMHYFVIQISLINVNRNSPSLSPFSLSIFLFDMVH
jgi:hypothetical protein